MPEETALLVGVCLCHVFRTRRYCTLLGVVSLTLLGCLFLNREWSQKILGADINKIRPTHTQDNLEVTRAPTSSQQGGKQDCLRQPWGYQRSVPSTTCFQSRRLNIQCPPSPTAATVSSEFRIRFQDKSGTTSIKSNAEQLF